MWPWMRLQTRVRMRWQTRVQKTLAGWTTPSSYSSWTCGSSCRSSSSSPDSTWPLWSWRHLQLQVLLQVLPQALLRVQGLVQGLVRGLVRGLAQGSGPGLCRLRPRPAEGLGALRLAQRPIGPRSWWQASRFALFPVCLCVCLQSLSLCLADLLFYSKYFCTSSSNSQPRAACFINPPPACPGLWLSCFRGSRLAWA